MLFAGREAEPVLVPVAELEGVAVEFVGFPAPVEVELEVALPLPLEPFEVLAPLPHCTTRFQPSSN